MVINNQNNLRPSLKEGVGRALRFFVFTTLFVLLIINWQTVKEIFDYKVIYSGIISSISFNTKTAIKVPNIVLSEPQREEKYQPKFTDKQNSIEIPRIEIVAPIVFVESTDNKDYDKALKKGVAHYFGSALPDQKGQTMILGHSAPPGWPKINYDWVFTKLNDLVAGDEIIVNYNNGEYHYKVAQKYILKQGDDVPHDALTNSKYMVVLISCWPPGVNYKRIAIEAELIK